MQTGRPRIHQDNNCIDCGTPITRGKSIRCSKCYGITIQNENHWKWKGDKVGYDALHVWMRKNKLKPEFCEICGKSKPLELSCNGIYDRNFENWEYLCVPCHRDKDFTNTNMVKSGAYQWRGVSN